MKSSGNMQNEIADSEHGYVNGVGVKKVVVIDGLGNLVNSTPTTQTNPSLVLTQTDNVVASTKTLTMTIGATPYVATLSYNASGQFLSISAWS